MSKYTKDTATFVYLFDFLVVFPVELRYLHADYFST